MKKRNFILVFLIVVTLSCGSYPPGYAVWMTWEGRTRTFVRDRDFISSNCKLFKREEAILTTLGLVLALLALAGTPSWTTEVRPTRNRRSSLPAGRLRPRTAVSTATLLLCAILFFRIPSGETAGLSRAPIER